MIEVESTLYKKLPTLRQFLRQNGKKKLAEGYPVFYVWKPYLYPNISLETEKFRVSVSEDNPAFNAILNLIEHCHNKGEGLIVRIRNKDSAAWAVEPYGDNWDIVPLGTTGLKFVAVPRG